MAKNDLTPSQDIVTREFFVRVALAPNALPANKALKRQLSAICLELLNYNRLSDGRFISKDKEISMAYGTQPNLEDYPDEWDEDYEAALQGLEAEAAASKGQSRDQAYSGKSAKDTKVWKTLLSKNL